MLGSEPQEKESVTDAARQTPSRTRTPKRYNKRFGVVDAAWPNKKRYFAVGAAAEKPFVAPSKKRRVMQRDMELTARLKVAACLADSGEGTDTTGMSDDQFLALLRR